MRISRLSATAGLLAAGCVADTIDLEALERVIVEPQRIDFDSPGVPCGAYTRPLTITNLSGVPLTIDRIVVAGGRASAFSVDDTLMGTTLGPGRSATFDLSFAATEDGVYRDRVLIEGRIAGMAFVRVVVVRGLIAADGTHEDDFVQRQTGDADILFVIDNSCSMAPEQDALGRNFRSFIEIADSGLLNYRIAVTTTDVSQGDDSAEGRFVPLDPDERARRIVSRDSLPTALAHFTENARVGIEGSGEERGLQAAYLALSPALLESHNGNFLRDHALLSLVFVSDEEDLSPESVDFYAQHFVGLKDGDASRVTMSAIVGDVPGGCTGDGGVATEARRYAALVDRFQGVVESICAEDVGRVLGKISAVAFGLRASFGLTAAAKPETIVVTVNGRVVPRTDQLGRVFWSYVARSNALVFEPRAIPGPGASIHVEYGAACFSD